MTHTSSHTRLLLAETLIIKTARLLHAGPAVSIHDQQHSLAAILA